MKLNEKQIEMYKDCTFLNEGIVGAGLTITAVLAILTAADVIVEGVLNKKAIKALPIAMDDYASIKKLPKCSEVKLITLGNNSFSLDYINKHPELKKYLIKDYETTHDEKPKSDKDLIQYLNGFCFEYQNKLQFYMEFVGYKNSMQHCKFFNKIFTKEHKNYVDAIAYIKLVQESNLKISINVRNFINEYKRLKNAK